MSSIIVVGHKNPDNDAISAAVGYAYLKNELARRAGEEAVFEPVRLGPLPPETEWIMGERGIEQPRLIESVPEGAKVILVDHNEMLQSVDGLNTDDLVEVVDHHRLGGPYHRAADSREREARRLHRRHRRARIRDRGCGASRVHRRTAARCDAHRHRHHEVAHHD